jgi:hypothetical protein
MGDPLRQRFAGSVRGAARSSTSARILDSSAASRCVLLNTYCASKRRIGAVRFARLQLPKQLTDAPVQLVRPEHDILPKGVYRSAPQFDANFASVVGTHGTANDRLVSAPAGRHRPGMR